MNRSIAFTLFLFGASVGQATCDRSPSSSPAASSVAPTPPTNESVAASSTPPTARASAPSSGATVGSTVVSFDAEKVGEPSAAFEAVVGDWYVAEENGARGLKVDGGKWRNGTPSVNLADQAKRLYGDRYAEFLDGVKAFAFFPLAVWNGSPPTGDVRISVRFYPEAGKVDQAAGIAFGVAPDGSYLGARANALEDNLLFFKVVKGQRHVSDTIRSVATASRQWHTIAVELRGAEVKVEVDGTKKLQKTLEKRPEGRLGLWSKADSQVLFDDFSVQAL